MAEITLVVGATGLLGMEIVRQLRSQNRSVRAAVRRTTDERKLSVLQGLTTDIVWADLKDPSSILDACKGVTSVISTATAMTSHQSGDSILSVDQQGQIALIRAAVAQNVEKFVFISFPPNQLDYAFQRAKRAVESELDRCGMAYTVLRSAPFMEVWFSPALGFDPLGQNSPSRSGKAQLWGNGEKPSNWISVVDVARYAVSASVGRLFKNQVLNLASADAMSPHQVLDIFKELTGKAVAVEYVPIAALEAQLVGNPDPVAQARIASALVVAYGQLLNSDEVSQQLPDKFASVRDWVRSLTGAASTAVSQGTVPLASMH